MSAVLAECPSLSLNARHRRLFVCLVSGDSVYACVTTAQRKGQSGKTLASVVGLLHSSPYRSADRFEIVESRDSLELQVGSASFEISEHEAGTIKATFGAHGLVDKRGPRP